MLLSRTRLATARCANNTGRTQTLAGTTASSANPTAERDIRMALLIPQDGRKETRGVSLFIAAPHHHAPFTTFRFVFRFFFLLFVALFFLYSPPNCFPLLLMGMISNRPLNFLNVLM